MTTRESDIDALFQVAPDEFTAARNALVTKLKKAGHAEEAARVKAMIRPSLSVWAVNQLYWRHRTAFDQLMAAGERLRKAQTSQLAGKGGDLRAALDARRAALSDLTSRAARLLGDVGHTAGSETLRHVTTTLDALATYGKQPSAPPAGRLTDDVDPPGFEALAALVPRKRSGARGNEPTRVIPFRQRPPRQHTRKKLDPTEKERQRAKEHKARIAAGTAAVRDAARTLRQVQQTAARAEAALKKAAAKAKEAEKRRELLAKPFEKAAAAAEHARTEARRIASDAEEAAQAVTDAEHALEQARRALASLS